MGLEKAIEHNKEHRKPYRGGKSVSSSCRNHGSCEWCRDNRLSKYNRDKKVSEKEIREYKKNS